jgi:hypothetical protein
MASKENSPNKKISSKSEKKCKYDIFVISSDIVIVNRSSEKICLRIDRTNGSSHFISKTELLNFKLDKSIPVFAVFGIIEISGLKFLITISRVTIEGQICNSEIMKVDSVKFLPISPIQNFNFDYEVCYDKLERIKEFLKTGFYFSYDYKLQSCFNGKTHFNPEELTYDLTRNHFIWNYKSIKEFLKSKNNTKNSQNQQTVDLLGLHPDINNNKEPKGPSKDKHYHNDSDYNKEEYAFFVPFIQGYVGIAENEEIKFLLISRRSYLMGGTRYNNRGVDNSGHVANYVETEQFVFFKNKILRFLQIRGSLPFYWEQVKGLLNPTVEIHQKKEINAEVFSKHVLMVLEKKYSKLFFFNLLSKSRNEEETLSVYLVDIIQNVSTQDKLKNKIGYEHVDFHGQTKQADFSGIDKYVYNLVNVGNNGNEIGFDEFEYSELLESHVIKSEQTVLIRTNCLDCLDRTNAMQTKIGNVMFLKMLEKCNSKSLLKFSKEDLLQPLKIFDKINDEFFNNLRRVWANNGDTISLIYAGTGATTSSVTRKGDQNTITSFLDHKMKTVRRFYLNTFDDNFKQGIIDILLHKKNQTIRQSSLYSSSVQNFVLEEVTLHLVSFLSVSGNGNLKISQETIFSIFQNKHERDLILIVTRNDKEKTIEIKSDDYLVVKNFQEAFDMVVKPPILFKMVETFSDSKFTLMLFVHANHTSRVSFSKSEKAYHTPMFPSIGQRSSFIIDHVGIEVFCLNLEKSSFNYGPDTIVEKLFSKYIDKEYDLVLFVVHLDKTAFEKISLPKNYHQICQIDKYDDLGKKDLNTILAFRSKEISEQGLEAKFSEIKINEIGLSKELIQNSITFALKKLEF